MYPSRNYKDQGRSRHRRKLLRWPQSARPQQRRHATTEPHPQLCHVLAHALVDRGDVYPCPHAATNEERPLRRQVAQLDAANAYDGDCIWIVRVAGLRHQLQQFTQYAQQKLAPAAALGLLVFA